MDEQAHDEHTLADRETRGQPDDPTYAMTVHKAETCPGYYVIIECEQDGSMAYNSKAAHREHGVFEGENDAASRRLADQHGLAMLDAFERLAETEREIAEQRDRDLKHQVVQLSAATERDEALLELCKKFKKAAKKDAIGRFQRQKSLAEGALKVTATVVWADVGGDPQDVAIKPTPSAWDRDSYPAEARFPTPEADVRSPASAFVVDENEFADGAVHRISGSGSFTLEALPSGELTLVLGDRCYVMEGRLSEQLIVVERNLADEHAPTPIAYKMMGARPKEMRERFGSWSEAGGEVSSGLLLGLFILERQRRLTRELFVKFITDISGRDGREDLMSGIRGILSNSLPDIEISPDLAGATLFSCTESELQAMPSDDLAATLAVVDDLQVAEWVLDIESGGDNRDQVIMAGRARRDQLEAELRGGAVG